MPSTHATLGMNRTGISTSPIQTKEMLKGMDEFAPEIPGDEADISRERVDAPSSPSPSVRATARHDEGAREDHDPRSKARAPRSSSTSWVSVGV